MSRQTVYGYTLGCRLNAYETEAILDEIERRCAFDRTADPETADVIVVNTCAVTARSQARSRKAVRSFLRRAPNALVAVTGCVVEVSPEDFSPEQVILIPNTEKAALVDRICERMGIQPLPGYNPGQGVLFPAAAPMKTARTRAFLKVQDGCDNRCVYCIVPRARGNSASQPREIVLRQARTLSEGGHREIALTGVDLVSYGKDLYGTSYGLPDLVRDLLEIGGFRVRIGSTEPIGLTRDALSALSLPGVCRHFHLPLQSGSDRILSAMGRKYGRQHISELLSVLDESFPGAAIGADIIVGFPGETDEDFAQTIDLATDDRIAYLHVFPFSPRKGTPAYDMQDSMLHPELVSERAVLLRGISAESRRVFRKSRVGEEALILVEGRMMKGRMIGLTDNYIPLMAPENSTEGELLRITISTDNVCWGLR